jgi:formamidopyrimidine-DNA glycosylase
MPEGPEIWILCEAINSYYKNKNIFSYGKHLFILDKKENWSFGLTGKVEINEKNELLKIETGWINGDQVKYENGIVEINKLGIDFMKADEHLIREEVDKWIKSKKKLAGLILDQSKISGIGVAWGSEILFKAGLRPDMRVCDQVIDKLADCILEIREKIKEKYTQELTEWDTKSFINEWFENLYEIREMNIYKKGSKLSVLGRSWWVI